MASAAATGRADDAAIVPASAVPEKIVAAERTVLSAFLKKLLVFVNIVFLLSVLFFESEVLTGYAKKLSFSSLPDSSSR